LWRVPRQLLPPVEDLPNLVGGQGPWPHQAIA
jgi:hypothetical protein